ncbi:MAG: hypothetical protein AAGD22_17305 [Verrucomicrobiota bacterium]
MLIAREGNIRAPIFAVVMLIFGVGSGEVWGNGSDRAVLVVVGTPGEEEYEELFLEAEGVIANRCLEAGVEYYVVGAGVDEGKDREEVERILSELTAADDGELWVILLGHGTYDGREAKFNVRGADFSATELDAWLAPKKEGVIVVNTASSSGPFLGGISGPGRVVITATKSGDEVFLTQFGRLFAEALGDEEGEQSDLDGDGQVSLLEVFLTASRGVSEYYAERGLLATEHSLLDDNGDKRGTAADWFSGVRVVKKAKEDVTPDGLRAHQVHLVPSEDELALPTALRKRRDELELEVMQLRYAKEEMSDEAYYRKLERVFVEMAALYDELGRESVHDAKRNGVGEFPRGEESADKGVLSGERAR